MTIECWYVVKGLITLTLLKEGPRAAIAMLMVLYWNSRTQMKTIQRRNQREQERKQKITKRNRDSLNPEECQLYDFNKEASAPAFQLH